MKKLFLWAVCALAMIMITQAQTGGAAVNPEVAQYDVNMLGNSIMGKLTPGLKLTAMQQQQVTTVISAFLTLKENIIPLKTSNLHEYYQKQSGLFTRLKTRLGSILSKDQMNKFMGMKPTSYNPSNTLSQLFY